jgi:hypothetical protein
MFFVRNVEDTKVVMTASDKIYQLLVHGRWFSPCTLASSTSKTGRHDIAEILLKVALNTKNQSIKDAWQDLVVVSSILTTVYLMFFVRNVEDTKVVMTIR